MTEQKKPGVRLAQPGSVEGRAKRAIYKGQRQRLRQQPSFGKACQMDDSRDDPLSDMRRA